jgi:tetratricopeptide (TPR) repeat protein
MLAVGKSDIQTKPYGAPKTPSWDNGIAYGFVEKKLKLEINDPFSQAYMDAQYKSVRKKPNISQDPVGLLQIGDFHFFNGKFGRAEKAYKEAARASADKTQSYAKLIQVLQAQHKPTQVLNYYDMLADLNIDEAPYIMEKIAYSLNNIAILGIETVGSLIDDALVKYPNNEELINLKGIFYLISGDLKQAKREFGKVIYINPLNLHGNNNLGVVYAGLGNDDKALEYYNSAIVLNPRYVTGYENIASIYTSQHKFSKAINILDRAKAESLQLTDQWDHHYGFLLIQLNKLDQALIWYKEKIKQEPDNHLLYNNLAKTYELQGQTKLSMDSYEKAASIAKRKIESDEAFDTRIWLPFHNLMTLYDRYGKEDYLIDTVAYVLKYNPLDWRAKYFKSLVCLRADDYETSKKLLEEVTKAVPNSAEALFNLSFIYAIVEKRYDYGLELLYRVNSLVENKKNPLLQNNIAYILIKKGEFEQAKSILKKNKGSDQYLPFLATYGLYHFAKNDPETADKYYKKAIDGLKGKQKKIARQIWHREKAAYFLKTKQTPYALKEINTGIDVLKSGYSYEDALDLKGRIITVLEKQLKS